MTDFRLVVSEPKSGKTFQKVLTLDEGQKLYGKTVGETFRGELFGLTGYELKITGGTDKDGFPMRIDVEGTGRKRLMLSSGPGFKPDEKGLRRRKMIRAKIIGPDISQLNTMVVKKGSIDLATVFPVKEGKTEAKTEPAPENKA